MTAHAGRPARIRLGVGVGALVVLLGFLVLIAVAIIAGAYAEAQERAACLQLGGFLTQLHQCVKVGP